MNPSKVTRKLKRLKFSKNTKCGFFSKHWTGSLANWWKIELESSVKHEMEPESVKGVVNSLFLPVREVLKDSRTLEIRLVWVRRITPSTSSIEWRCHDLRLRPWSTRPRLAVWRQNKLGFRSPQCAQAGCQNLSKLAHKDAGQAIATIIGQRSFMLFWALSDCLPSSSHNYSPVVSVVQDTGFVLGSNSKTTNLSNWNHVSHWASVFNQAW